MIVNFLEDRILCDLTRCRIARPTIGIAIYAHCLVIITAGVSPVNDTHRMRRLKATRICRVMRCSLLTTSTHNTR